MTAEPVPSLGREAGSALRWNAAGVSASLLSQFFQILILARLLPPDQFGLASTALAIAGFAGGFADLGLSNGLVQHPQVEKKTWAGAVWASVFAGSVLFGLLAASASGLAAMLHLQGLAPLVCAAGLIVPFTGTAAIFQAHRQRELRFTRVAMADLFAAFASLAAALGWVFWRREAAALIVGQIALYAVRCLTLCAPRIFLSGFPDWKSLRPLVSFGGYQMGERALNYAAGNMDRLIVARILGAGAAGYYTVASQIALRPLALLAPFVFRTLFPLLSRLREEGDRLASSFLRAVSLLGFLAAPAFALLFALATPLSRWVLGAGWGPVAPLLRVLAVLGFIWTMSQPLGSVTLALGKARVSFWFNALMLAVNAAAVWCGARFGLMGAAWGMLTAALILLPLDFYLVRRWLGISPARFAAAAFFPTPGRLREAIADLNSKLKV